MPSFLRQQEAPDLFEWLCIEELRLCCPAGRFGPECAGKHVVTLLLLNI